MEYILLAIAMLVEANPFIEKLENKQKINLFGYETYIGQYKKLNIIIGISGVGTINMSGMIHTILLNYNIKLILNYGVAGGYGNNIHKGDIIVITECLNTNSFRTSKTEKGEGIKVDNIEYLNFEPEEAQIKYYKADEKIINQIKQIKDREINVIYGRIGSGDMWNREYDKIMYNYEKYKLLCEDMEAAAVYQIGEKFKKPFLSIKGISNNEILNEEYDYSVLDNLVKFVEVALHHLNTL